MDCKLNITNDLETKTKIYKLAKKFDLPQSTVCTIIKVKEKVVEAVKDASSTIRKRHGIITQMEIFLKLWCDNQVKVKNSPVDQNIVCSQAKQIFEKISCVRSQIWNVIVIGTALQRV